MSSSAHEKRVEPLPVGVVNLRVVSHVEPGVREALLQPGVEVHERGVDVVQKCAFGAEAECDRQPAAERLHEPSVAKVFPIRLNMRDEPPLAAGPLEGGRQFFITGCEVRFANLRIRACCHVGIRNASVGG